MAHVHAELVYRNVECLERLFPGLANKRLVLWVENNLSQDLCSFLEYSAKTRWSRRRVVAMVKTEDSEGRKIPGVTTNKKGCLVEHALRALERNVFLVRQFSTQARIVHAKFAVLADGEDRAVADIVARIDADRAPAPLLHLGDDPVEQEEEREEQPPQRRRRRRRPSLSPPPPPAPATSGAVGPSRKRKRSTDEDDDDDDDDDEVDGMEDEDQGEAYEDDEDVSDDELDLDDPDGRGDSRGQRPHLRRSRPFRRRRQQKRRRKRRTLAFPDVSEMFPTEEDRKTVLKTLVRQADQYVYDPTTGSISGKRRKLGGIERDDMTTALLLALGWAHSNMTVIEDDQEVPVPVTRIWHDVAAANAATASHAARASTAYVAAARTGIGTGADHHG